MATYILTWNPKKWTWTDLDESIEAVRSGERHQRIWSTGVTRRIQPGDRMFLLRQGVKPKGIMGSGYATTTVFDHPHYDKARAAKGETAPRVMVEFDVMLEPGGEGFLPTELLSERVPGVYWQPNASGMSIEPAEAAKLEALWKKGPTTQALQRRDEDEPDLFREGEIVETKGKRRRRDGRARSACVEHHGTACVVCGFDFEAVYGDLGRGFVHVHHRVDLAEYDGEKAIDPIDDLVPVCPNCHAMLHTVRPAHSIERLREIMRERRAR